MQEHSEVGQSTAADERLLAAFDEIEFLREQVESWRGIAQELELKLRETEQELEYTNQDLSNALRLDKLEFEQCIELPSSRTAHSLSLESEKVFANSKELIANSKESKARSKHLHLQYKEFGVLFISLRANYIRFQQKFNDFITQSKENDVSTNPTKINDLSCSTPRKTA